jgi:Flp pilus assembly protein TadG
MAFVKTPSSLKQASSRCRGTALVEAALVLSVLMTITFGAIEYGWMFLKEEQVTDAARAAARVAAPPDATTAQATTLVTSMMSSAGMGSSGYTLTFTPTDISTVSPGSTFTVQVSVPYSNVTITHVTLVPVPTTISSTITMSKEGP